MFLIIRGLLIMTFIDVIIAIIFGIVEGITEWLPISSTGHMIVLNEFLKINVSEEFKSLYFVVIQLGAILAVILIYFKEIWAFCKAFEEVSYTNGVGKYIVKDKFQLWVKI